MNIYIDKKFHELLKNPESWKDKYINAKPFPHIIINNFINCEVLENVLEEFPNHSNNNFSKKFINNFENKIINTNIKSFGNYSNKLINYFHSKEFINFLSELTDIKEELQADPLLLGGGFHKIKKDVFLKILADFNIHPKLKLQRRINLLLYLNNNWKEEFGGHLEFWDNHTFRKKILPIFNRLVIFTTSSDSFHGNPEPLKSPPEITRKSLAIYYYSKSFFDKKKIYSHSTIFLDESFKTKYIRAFKKLIKTFLIR